MLALNNGKAPELKPDLAKKNTSTPKPVASPAKQRTYRVVKGDTLAKIAKKYGKSWQSIYNANRNIVKNPNRIYPGQVLQIPN
jgi:nucleoid-associated protein YgaU